MPNRLDRVEGRHRFLKDHPDFFPTDFTKPGFGQLIQILRLPIPRSKVDAACHAHG